MPVALFFHRPPPLSLRGGFTLVELLVVVLIIGIMAAIATPMYFKVVEKGRFAEASGCLNLLAQAQERYYMKSGSYAGTLASLDTSCATMQYYSVGSLSGTTTQFTAVLNRVGSTPAYGGYQLTFIAGNGVLPTYSCNNASCTQDLLP